MKELKDFLLEAKAPTFTNDIKGIKAFCEYVFNPDFYFWTINPDETITVGLHKVPANGVQNAYMDTKDLTEIPDFIVFSNIEKIALGIGTGSDCKVKDWAPKVKGYCAGIIADNRPKLQSIDLSECEIRDGKLYIEMTGVKSIVGGHGEGVQLMIKKNKNLSELNISKIGYAHGSYIANNRSLIVKKNQVPEKINSNGDLSFIIEKNKGGYETYGAVTKWDKE